MLCHIFTFNPNYIRNMQYIYIYIYIIIYIIYNIIYIYIYLCVCVLAACMEFTALGCAIKSPPPAACGRCAALVPAHQAKLGGHVLRSMVSIGFLYSKI